MKQKGLAPILIIVLIALVATAAYFLGTKNILKLPAFFPIPALSPSPTPDPTADWKTYMFKNKISFRYPESLQIKVFDENSLLLTGEDSIHEFRVNTFLVPQGQTLYQFIYNNGVGDNYGKEYLDGNHISLTFTDVSQNPLYKIWEPSSWPSANGILIRFIQNKGQVVWFSLEPYNPGGTPIPNEKEYGQIFDQILSTFQFSN